MCLAFHSLVQYALNLGFPWAQCIALMKRYLFGEKSCMPQFIMLEFSDYETYEFPR